MGKIIFLLLCFLFTQNVFAQNRFDVKLYDQSVQQEVVFMVDNNEYCPVSIEIKFELNNMKASTDNRIFVIPARTKNYELVKISPAANSKKWGWNYEYFINYGDALQKEYEADFNYTLPFKDGQSIKIVQGYNGKFSHQNENALDFGMKVGDGVYSAREGIVVNVVSNHNKSCSTKDCAKFNNFILVYHPDGTFASYSHLKQNGAIVKKGDKIKQNQLIGYSGNTGWSSGPHLHFSVFLQRIEQTESLKTKFLTGNGTKSEFLKDGVVYTK